MPLYGKIVVIKRSGADGAHFPLTSTSCLVGRSNDCDIRIQLPNVSKEHCRIDVNQDGQLFLTNLSQVNTTVLNGRAMINQSTPVGHNDIFTINDRSFRVEFLPVSRFCDRSTSPMKMPLTPTSPVTYPSETPAKVRKRTPANAPGVTPEKSPAKSPAKTPPMTQGETHADDNMILNMTEFGTDTSVAKPWDDGSEEGQKMADEDPRLIDPLFHSMRRLRTEMVLSDEFWDMLLQKAVIDEKLKAEIQACDSKVQVCHLVGQLLNGKVHQVHGFLWALVNTKQHHLVEMMGFPAKIYFDVQSMPKSSCIYCASCCDVFTNKAYILVECGHYICRPCIKGAPFIVQDDKTEGITCPVAECGVVTKTLPNMDDKIALEEDEVFMDIVGDLMKGFSTDGVCHLCSSIISLSFQKHFCTGCKKLLCATCIGKHEGNGHQIIHKHTADVCCFHGNTAVCLYCHRRCRGKNQEQCEHTAPGEAKKMNTGLQYMETQLQDVEIKEEEFKKLDAMLEIRETEMMDFVQHQHDRVKKDMEKWLEESVSYISRMSRHVRVKHMQSLQWKALSSDLISVQADQPWADLHLDKLDLNLSPAMMTFVSNVRDGEPPAKIFPPLPYLPAPDRLPTIAKYMGEWQIPSSRPWPTVAWTSDGQLLVTTLTGLHQIKYDVRYSSYTASLIHTATNPSQISTAEDGSWVMTMVTGELFINDVNKGGIKEWTPPGIKAFSAAIDNSGIYVMGRVSPTVYIYVYSRDLMLQRQYQIDPKWLSKIGLIYIGQRDDLLLGLSYSNAVLVMNSKTGECRSIINKGTKSALNYPFGVCTVVGNKYILVSESNKHCVSVFTYQGEYLHDLQVEGGAGDPHSVSILERPGEPTLMALTIFTNKQWYVKLYTLS